jgi:hypothetical protein
MKPIIWLLSFFWTSLAFAQTGITWGIPTDVEVKGSGNNWPHVVLDKNQNPIVIWQSGSDKGVYVARWTGSGFSTPLKITPASFSTAGSYWMGPDVASKGDTAYVVMKRAPENDTTNHIYLAASFNGGMSFGQLRRVDFIGENVSRFPTVTIDQSGNPLVAFMKFNPDFSNSRWVVLRSTDYGETFTADVKASGWSGGEVCDCCPGTILSTGNQVAMLYRDNLNNLRDMWAGISTDGGASFTSGTAIDKGKWMLNSCPSSGPDGVILGDTLYSVYMSGSGGTNLVYLSKYCFSTNMLSDAVPLTGKFTGLYEQNMPRIALFGNSAAVVWKQKVGGADQVAIRYAKNMQKGFTAGYDFITSANVMNADLSMAAGKLFVVWQDNMAGTVRFREGTLSTSGIDELPQALSFTIWPNPVQQQLLIKADIQNAEVTVTDAVGRQIFNGRYPAHSDNFSINTSTWQPGMYFVKIENGSEGCTKKIFKTQ